jgi:WD40 repeat protein
MTTMETASPIRLDKEHPWPALLAFMEKDADFFGGRESEANETFRAIVRDMLTVLYGVSGLGKTSLLGAGVFPLLRRANYFPVHIRLDHSDLAPALVDQVKQEIASEAAAHGVEVPEMPRSRTLWKCFHRRDAEFWGARNQLLTPVLVFDQFEEIFTKGGIDSARVTSFLDELADLVTGVLRKEAEEEVARDESSTEERLYRYREHRYRVVFALREDFVTQLEALSGRFRSIFSNRVKLLPMSGKAALESTLHAGGHLIDSETATRVVRVVSGEPDPAETGAALGKELDDLVVEPALLSLFCSELNERRLATNETKINPTVLSTKSRDEILTNFYNRCVEGLGDSARQFIEDDLLSTDGRTRDTISVDRALAEGKIDLTALEKLVGSRLLRIEETRNARRIELSHDVLTSVVRASREQRRRDEQISEEKKARQEAQSEARAARRTLRRTQTAVAVLLILFVAAIVGPLVVRHFMKKREAAHDYQMALQHSKAGSAASAMAYMARAVRLDPDHLGARAMLSNMLLNRNWPVEILRFQSTERKIGDISRDGQRLLTMSSNGIEIRNADGRMLFPPIAIPTNVDVSFSPSDRGVLVVANGSERGKSFSVYDATTGKRVLQHSPSSGLTYPIDLTADGLAVIYYTETLEIRVVDVATKADRSSGISFLTFSKNYRDATWGPGYRLMITFTEEPGETKVEQPRILDVLGRSAPVLLDRHEEIGFTRFLGDGALIAVADLSNNLYIHDTRNGRQVFGPKGHDGLIHDVDISPDGKHLVVAHGDNTVTLWPIDAGDPVTLRHNDEVVSARFSEDSTQVVTASVDGAVRCWNVRNGTAIAEVIHGRGLEGAVFAGDARRVLAVDVDHSVVEWRIVRSHNATDVLDIDKPVTQLDVTADGALVLIAMTNELLAFDVARRSLLRRRKLQPSESTSINPFDGSVFITLGKGRIWDPRLNVETNVAVDDAIASGQFSRNGRVLVVETFTMDHQSLRKSSTLRFMDVRTLTEKGRISGISSSAANPLNYSVNYSGDRIALLDGDQLALYDDHGTAVGRPNRIHTLGKTNERPFAFSEDGTYLITYSDIDGVRIWDAHTAQLRSNPFDSGEQIRFASMQGDNRLLITLGDRTAGVWDWKEKKLIGPRINSGEQNVRAWLLTNDRLLTIGARTSRVWDIRNGIPIGETLRSSVPPAMNGDSMLRASGRYITRVDLSPISEAEATILADMAESVAGVRVNDDGEFDEVSAAEGVSAASTACHERSSSSAVCQTAVALAADPLLHLKARTAKK